MVLAGLPDMLQIPWVSISGAIEGTSSIEYLMSYSVHGTATFVGLERVSGTVDGKTGTLIVQHFGSFSEGKARSSG